MRIAQLISTFYPKIGGAQICIHNISEKLAEMGHEVYVVTIETPDVRNAQVKYNIITLPKNIMRLLKYAPILGKVWLRMKMRKINDQEKIDIWQVTFGFPLGIYAVKWFKKNNIPCILRTTGEDINVAPEIGYGYRLNPHIDKLIKKYYRMYDGLIALTPSVLDEYLKIGIYKEDVRIIPNGVNYDSFHGTNVSDRAQIVENLDKKEKLILTVGRHHPIKGYDIIPEIASRLIEKKIKFKWLIVGSGYKNYKERHNLESLNIHAMEISTTENIDKFELPAKKLIELYKMSDIFVFPTRLETFGMVIVEAMASGVPIITTNAEGVRDIIQDMKNGIKVPIDDVDAFVKSIEELLTNDNLRNTLSQNGIKRVKELYDWNIVAPKYLEFYKEIIKNKHLQKNGDIRVSHR